MTGGGASFATRTLTTRARTGGTGADSSLPGSLNPNKGAFQLLNRSVLSDKAANAYNGKSTTATKAKKINDRLVRGVMVFPTTDLVALLLFVQADLQADLDGTGTNKAVMVGAGSSDPDKNQVLAVDQGHALGYMLLPVLASLYAECEEQMEASTVLEKYHRGEEFVVSSGHCYESVLTADETYHLFLLPVGPALYPGTTPPRGSTEDALSTATQGGQPSLPFLIRAFMEYSPAEAKAAQEIAVTNKQALGKAYPPVPQGATLVSTYLTPCISADTDNPQFEKPLAGGVAACLGEKKAALQQ